MLSTTSFGSIKSLLLLLLFPLCCRALITPPQRSNRVMMPNNKLVRIAEPAWRAAAAAHAERVFSILQPGLLKPAANPTTRRQQKRLGDDWTGLDPKHPIFNFLIEYYGIKGSKGTRRIARWSPDPALLITEQRIEDCQSTSFDQGQMCLQDEIYHAAMQASAGRGGILLENANLDDMGGKLHLRGAIPVPSLHDSTVLHGMLYNPALFYERYEPFNLERRQRLLKKIAPFQWYKSIMETTLESEPIMHCHGLHEWAMVYHPEGSPPPPSAKYQAHLPLRVSRQVINETVERRGLSCTHVDALRFFAPAAGPLNHHGSSLERMDQLRLEQKACVHAHMDLLKIALKLQPFIGTDLLGDVLEMAIKARTLDVEASPYDVTAYGAGFVPVETKQGRKMYREQQRALMEQAEPVRIRLLDAYDTFLRLAFEPDLIHSSSVRKQEKQKGLLIQRDQIETSFAGRERYAKAEPGGLPWRRNLINNSK